MNTALVRTLEEYPHQAVGTRSATAPASWGQRFIYERIVAAHPHEARLNVAVVVALPSNATLELAGAAVASLVSRHEAFRTRYVESPSGRLMQVVDERVTFALAVWEGAAENAAALSALMREDRFDFDSGRQFRAGVLRCASSMISHLILVCSHMVLDGWSGDLVEQELNSTIRAGRVGHPPPPTFQMVEQSALESTSSHVRKSERATRYWCEQLQRHSCAMVSGGPGGVPTSESFANGSLFAPSSFRAAAALAQRTGTSPASVVLASFVTVLHHLFNVGDQHVSLMTRCSNRLSRDCLSTVGHLSQHAPLSVAVDPLAPAKTIRAAFSASVSAVRYGHYDPVMLNDVLAASDLLNKASSMQNVVYNSVGANGRVLVDGPDEDVQYGDYRAGATRDHGTVSVWLNAWPPQNILDLFVDTSVVAAGEIERPLREMEQFFAQTLSSL